MGIIQTKRTEFVKRNLIWRTLYTIINTVFPFVIRSLMIRYMGEEYMGLNSFCTSMLEILNVTNLGIETAFQFHLFKPISEDNKEEIYKLLKFYRKMYYMIGSIIMFFGLCMMPFLNKLIKSDIPKGVSIHLVFTAFLLSQALGYFISTTEYVFLSAKQEAYISMLIYNISAVLCYGLQIVCVIKKNYYVYILLVLLMNLLHALGCLVYSRCRNRDIYKYNCDSNLSPELQRSILLETFSVAVYRVRDVTRNSMDSVIISAFVGLKLLSRYQNYFMVLKVPYLLKTIFTYSVTASLGDYNASNNKEKTYEVFRIILFVNVVISGWCSIVYYNLIQDFIVIWVGSGAILDTVCAGLFSVYLYILGLGDVMKMLRSVTGEWSKGKVVAALEMMANVVLNIGLVIFMGLPGIILSTVLTMVIIYLPYEFYVMAQYMFKGKLLDTLKIIGQNVLWTVSTGIIVVIICAFVPKIHFWGLCMKAAISIVVPALSFFICFGRSKLFKDTLANFFSCI